MKALQDKDMTDHSKSERMIAGLKRGGVPPVSSSRLTVKAATRAQGRLLLIETSGVELDRGAGRIQKETDRQG